MKKNKFYITPLIMVGGLGKRLCPLSRRSYPKQFNKLSNERNFQVKTITSLPGESLSLQKHKYRSENWVVVSGVATVILDKKLKILNVGESIFIPKGAIYRLENEKDKNLV